MLEASDILALVGQRLTADGYAGTTTPAKVLYLGLTSRLLPRPVNFAVTGPSAVGKNHAIGTVIPLFPSSAYYDLTGSSPLALIYTKENFEHRYVIVGEAAALHQDGIGASMMRGLVWGNKLSYDTVIDGEPVHLEQVGPTGLITTTTKHLERELATRVWSVVISDDAMQTREVMRAIARKLSGRHQPEPAGLLSVEQFRAAQEWLVVAGERQVVIPWGEALQELLSDREVRMRRDLTQLMTLIEAHALLHQRNRERHADGRVVATLEDYAAVRALVEPVFAGSVSSGVTKEVRATVEVVAKLTPSAGDVATISSVAAELNMSVSGTWHRVGKAIRGGWVVNLETRRRQPARLCAGEPLPDDVPALPEPEVVAERHAKERQDQPDFDSNVQTGPQLQVQQAHNVAASFERLNETLGRDATLQAGGLGLETDVPPLDGDD